MTDDDVERRLRSALHAKANRAVGADDALPAMATPAGAPQTGRVPLRVLPALAAAALVASVIGGSVLVAGANRHSGPGHPPTSTVVAKVGTTTAGSLAPTGTLSEPPTAVPPSSVAVPTTFQASGASNSAPVAPPRAAQSSPSTPPTPPMSTPTTPTTTRAHRTSPGRTSSPTAGPSTVTPTTQSTQPSGSVTPPAPSSTATTPTHRPTHSPTHSPSSPPTTSPTSTPTHPPTSTPPPTQTTSAAPPPPSTPPCTTASLTIDLGGDRTTGTPGGDYAFLNVTNNGAPCTLSGFATVRIYDGSGALIAGPAPHRAGSNPQKLTLQRGGGAQFEVYDVDDGTPACAGDYRSGRYLQTYLPGQSTAITTPTWGYSPCQLSVTALHAPTSQQPTS